jgi:hypothetical protein
MNAPFVDEEDVMNLVEMFPNKSQEKIRAALRDSGNNITLAVSMLLSTSTNPTSTNLAAVITEEPTNQQDCLILFNKFKDHGDVMDLHTTFLIFEEKFNITEDFIVRAYEEAVNKECSQNIREVTINMNEFRIIFGNFCIFRIH